MSNETNGGDGAGALEGIRVLDVGVLVQAPQCAQTLGDLGAEVIKVELPMLGDQARWIPIDGDDLRPPYFHGCNRGKKSVTIDLRVDAGREIFLRLIETADVLVSNFKPGTLDEWGLGDDALHARNPGLIHAAGSVWGTEGPAPAREGADLAGQAAGGLISTTGVDGGEPTPVGVTIADHIASQNMTAGVLAALYARTRTGKGQRVDVSLFGGQIYAQASEYTYYFLSGRQPGRSNRGHAIISAAYGIVPTADGWLAIVGVPPAQRDLFYTAIGRPELALDERFQSLLFSAEDKRALFAELSETFPSRTTAEWCEILHDVGCRYAPVNDYAAAAADPHAAANGYVRRVEHPEFGELMSIGSPIAMSANAVEPGVAAPGLGEHTDEILAALGYEAATVADLRAGGVI